MAFIQKKTATLNIGGQTQDTILFANKKRNLTIDEMTSSYNKINTKFKTAHKKGQIMVRALTIYGWRTFKGFHEDDLNLMDEQNYLVARGENNNGKFIYEFLQILFILKY